MQTKSNREKAKITNMKKKGDITRGKKYIQRIGGGFME